LPVRLKRISPTMYGWKVRRHDIPVVERTSEPVDTAARLLLLQERRVTADVHDLYDHLKTMVRFSIEPQEGLLVIEFAPENHECLAAALQRFGCQWTPVEDDSGGE